MLRHLKIAGADIKIRPGQILGGLWFLSILVYLGAQAFNPWPDEMSKDPEGLPYTTVKLWSGYITFLIPAGVTCFLLLTALTRRSFDRAITAMLVLVAPIIVHMCIFGCMLNYGCYRVFSAWHDTQVLELRKKSEKEFILCQSTRNNAADCFSR